MLVTTGGRTTKEWIEKAIQIAHELNITYVPRRKRSIEQMQKEYNDDCLVVGRARLDIFEKNQQVPFFFHPNAAMLRVKRIKKGETDPFIEAGGLAAGMTLLDCTLGLAADSIVASYVTGSSGTVTGIEQNLYLAYVVKQGLLTWDSHFPDINDALRRIEVKTGNHLEMLKTLDDQSVDVIYFDPMFEETITESNGIRALAALAIHKPLTNEVIQEAKRVAKKRIILKDHYKSGRFSELGFQVIKRKTSKFHFGIIELSLGDNTHSRNVKNPCN